MAIPCSDCILNVTACYTPLNVPGAPAQGGIAVALVSGNEVVWYDSITAEPIDPDTVEFVECGQFCDGVQPTAENVPWIIAPDGLSATKTVGTTVITATVIGRGHPSNVLWPLPPLGVNDPNALTNTLNGGGGDFIDISFDANVAQPDTITRVIDVDPSGGEWVQFFPPHQVPPTSNTSILGQVPPIYNGTNSRFETAGPNSSGQVSFIGIPWGNGNPVIVRFGRDATTGSVRSSQFDFAGPLVAQPCIP